MGQADDPHSGTSGGTVPQPTGQSPIRLAFSIILAATLNAPLAVCRLLFPLVIAGDVRQMLVNPYLAVARLCRHKAAADQCPDPRMSE